MIGIHTPEFARERNRDSIERYRQRSGITYSSYIDNDHAYWDALDNHYWPTIYVLDTAGRIRHVQIGEVHAGKGAAAGIESLIETLLTEQTPEAN